METVECVEAVVRRLMERPAAVGLPPDYDFALLLRDLKREFRSVGGMDVRVKALRVPGPTVAGCFRIEFPLALEADKVVVTRLYGRIEDGRVSRMWRVDNLIPVSAAGPAGSYRRYVG